MGTDVTDFRTTRIRILAGKQYRRNHMELIQECCQEES